MNASYIHVSFLHIANQYLQDRIGTFTFVTFYIQFLLTAVQFICSLIPDHGAILIPTSAPALRSESTALLGDASSATSQPITTSHAKLNRQTIEGVTCPKIGATFLSVMFFQWFTP